METTNHDISSVITQSKENGSHEIMGKYINLSFDMQLSFYRDHHDIVTAKKQFGIFINNVEDPRGLALKLTKDSVGLSYLKNNIQFFPDSIDIITILHELIKKGEYSGGIFDTSMFQSLDKTQFVKDIFKSKNNHFLESVPKLNFSVARRLLDIGDTDNLIRCINNFSPEDHPKIAKLLIESNNKRIVISNLRLFSLKNISDLDPNTTNNEVDSRMDLIYAAKNISSFSSLNHQELINKLIANKNYQVVAEHLSSFSGVDFSEIIPILERNGAIDLNSMLLNLDFDSILILVKNGYKFDLGNDSIRSKASALIDMALMMKRADCPRYAFVVTALLDNIVSQKPIDKLNIPDARSENIKPYESFNVCGQTAGFYLKKLFEHEYLQTIKQQMKANAPTAESGELGKDEQEFRKLDDRTKLAEVMEFTNEGVDELADILRQYILQVVAEETLSLQPIFDRENKLFNNPKRLLEKGNVEEIQKFFMRSIMILSKNESGESTTRGGDSWVKIVELGMNLWCKNPNKSLLIDMAFDIVHNGGPIFNKDDGGRKFNYDKGKYIKLLDKKRDSTFEDLLVYCVDRDYITQEQLDRYTQMVEKALDLRKKLEDPLATKAAGYE